MAQPASSHEVDTFTFPDGVSVNRLGFGAMRLTGEGIWGEPADPTECKKVLKKALDLGVNFIDTADSYGPEVSERLIGETLYPYPDQLVIATKGGLERGGPNDWYPNGRPSHLRQAINGSLKRLKKDAVYLYQMHKPDPEVPYEESIGTLAELQREGKIKHIGVSNVTIEQLEKARRIVGVVTVQNKFNLATREDQDVLHYCEEHGIGFIPWYPLDTGNLSGMPPTDSSNKLEEIAKKYEATPSQIALAWLMQLSPVIIPIPGTSKVKHLEENMKAADIRLDEETIKALEQI